MKFFNGPYGGHVRVEGSDERCAGMGGCLSVKGEGVGIP